MRSTPLTHSRAALLLLIAAGLFVTPGCNGGGGGGGGGNTGGGGGGGTSATPQFISIGTAPQGGVFYTVGAAVSDVLDQNKAEGWRGVNAESTGGTLENLQLLDAEEIQVGMANSSITYFATRGEGGFEKKHDVKAVMTLFPLIAMFVTKEDSGIRTIEDLKGKRVVVGPEGAGFEYFIRPILAAHGLSYDDFDDNYGGMGSSVGYLQDGSMDATFIGGGIKAPAIATADSTMDIFLVPYGETQRQQLVDELPSFSLATIPAGTYKSHSEEYSGLNVGSAHLIVRADASDDFVYQVTKTIYENRATIIEKHAAAKSINEKNVIKPTGTDFHPGAIKYYKEAGIWPEDEAAGEERAATAPADGDAPADADAPATTNDGSESEQ